MIVERCGKYVNTKSTNKKGGYVAGYTKLFSHIVHSTVWREPDHVRLLWITMLALKDWRDVVNASIPGLADAARISLESCEEALKILSSPDAYSRSKKFEGRRIEECEGGWLILNGEEYRKRMNDDERREYKRLKQQEYRERDKQAATTLPEPELPPAPPPMLALSSDGTMPPTTVVSIPCRDGEFHVEQSQLDEWQAVFAAVDVKFTLQKIRLWCKANPTKQKTVKGCPRFVVTWLGKDQDNAGGNKGNGKPLSTEEYNEASRQAFLAGG